MFNNVIYIFLFGGLGSLTRYIIHIYLKKYSYLNFTTISVNLIGSFLIGFFLTIFLEKKNGSFLKDYILMGFLGGFTTFSGFSLDALQLIQKEKYILCLIYISLNVGLGIFMAYLGILLGKYLWKL